MSVLARAPVSAAAASRLALGVVRAEGARVAALSITFVGPARMRTLNRRHLGRDRATDVLAFAMGSPLVGDVYVCPAVAAQAAARFGTSAGDEVRRLVIHGVLHVLGYDHPEGAGRTTGAMWRLQERHLAGLGAGAR